MAGGVAQWYLHGQNSVINYNVGATLRSNLHVSLGIVDSDIRGP